MSQMELAFEADLSARHVSFVETGRSDPSRDALFAIADALDVPLRERNVLFETAGFARPYSEATLSEAELAHHRHLVASILQRHEPFFAVAIDRHWTVRLANRPAEQFLAQFFGPDGIDGPDPPNLARLLFHPAGLRSCITNWSAASAHFWGRLHRESVHNPLDTDLAALLEEIEGYGEIGTGTARPSDGHALVLELSMNDVELRLLGSVLAFDTARSPALEELRVETFFPADEQTARRLERTPLVEQETPDAASDHLPRSASSS
jgi:transcriptional regulator with XRE-family HTH domain